MFKKTLRYWLFILITSSFIPSAYAVIVDGIDLRVTMKQMRFEYNQAMKTESIDTFNLHLIQFKQQLAIANKFKFPDEKRDKAEEGLNKVTTLIDSLFLPITAENLSKTKERLSIIDELRDQYHDKKPSVWQHLWQMVFGEEIAEEKRN